MYEENEGVMHIDYYILTSMEGSHRDLLNYMAEHRSNMRVLCIMLIFQDRPMFCHILQKVSPRALF